MLPAERYAVVVGVSLCLPRHAGGGWLVGCCCVCCNCSRAQRFSTFYSSIVFEALKTFTLLEFVIIQLYHNINHE